MKTRFLVRMLTIFILALALPGAAGAQVLYGSLTGAVTDQTGAVVTGAKPAPSRLRRMPRRCRPTGLTSTSRSRPVRSTICRCSAASVETTRR